MKKDIIIPVIKDVHVAIIHEFNKEFLDKEWNVYVINNKTETIEMVLVVSKGYDNDRITSTMRHSIAKLDGKSYAKVEMVQEDVLQLNNEFFVTFFADNKLFEKRFVFEKNTVNEANLTTIPLIDKDGVLAK
ncbi:MULTISPECIES: hypothetical protein [Cellulophaga]|uniref:Phenylalanyl-tRNA synthetase subunit alpha n=1 Tax=Cellulophaga lytica (strain ATCC 23178 / DSM 7489 / JCM 8516 / NBRC 14961 / NCIMB 1423 / VKM B-1433 / Cy l20) TaxID=867900 RepID=F0RFN2_CELLC|nr:MULTISPECIES: hypothetical protein [Cellulophaga]ADY28980.1 hypothetical protein Celly_1152 [Cellulophaga lytica DSM 7489]APU09896.1 hypothetical protein A5M85_06250 [Cellulophaga lytica]MDO6491195.1 hypothetical protein [Cellulophaga sp. 2_MG-2023]MDO6495272.1 hypothetical protein [Cellulophaga sp. 3_MG-2023]MDO6854950.1 hypothetical protein [Cellulophaga lytica]